MDGKVLLAMLRCRYGLAIEVDDFTRKAGHERPPGSTVACQTPQVESLCRAQSLGGLNEALNPCDVVLAPANSSVGVFLAGLASEPEVSCLNNLKEMRFRTRDAGKPTPADDHTQNMSIPRPREREVWRYNLSLTSSKHSRTCCERYRQACWFLVWLMPSLNEVSVMMGTACAIASARPAVPLAVVE